MIYLPQCRHNHSTVLFDFQHIRRHIRKPKHPDRERNLTHFYAVHIGKLAIFSVNVKYDNFRTRQLCSFLYNLCDRFGLSASGIPDNAGMTLVEFVSVNPCSDIMPSIIPNTKSADITLLHIQHIENIAAFYILNHNIRTRIAVYLLLKYAVNHAPQNRTLNHFQRRLLQLFHDGIVIHLRFHVIIRDGGYHGHKLYFAI